MALGVKVDGEGLRSAVYVGKQCLKFVAAGDGRIHGLSAYVERQQEDRTIQCRLRVVGDRAVGVQGRHEVQRRPRHRVLHTVALLARGPAKA